MFFLPAGLCLSKQKQKTNTIFPVQQSRKTLVEHKVD